MAPGGRVRKERRHAEASDTAAGFLRGIGGGGLERADLCRAADVERIVAVGDVHGDYDQFVRTLRAAKVVDDKNDWIAGKAHLVQAGDVLDRGPDSRKAMDLLMKLQRQAAKAGGAVHALIGNHEAMVLLNDWRYVHPGELKAFGGARRFREAMSPRGKYGRWICGHNAVIKINDLLFVHAGLAPPAARMSLARINEAIRQELKEGDMEGISMNPFGPLWDRGLALGEEAEVVKRLDVVLKRYGAKRMVVAHTVCRDGVVTRAGLIRIDVGMSGFYGGPAACLLVEKGAFYEVRHPKTKRRLPLKAPASRPAATQEAPVPGRSGRIRQRGKGAGRNSFNDVPAWGPQPRAPNRCPLPKRSLGAIRECASAARRGGWARGGGGSARTASTPAPAPT